MRYTRLEKHLYAFLGCLGVELFIVSIFHVLSNIFNSISLTYFDWFFISLSVISLGVAIGFFISAKTKSIENANFVLGCVATGAFVGLLLAWFIPK